MKENNPGWTCPNCGYCWAPHIPGCVKCNKEEKKQQTIGDLGIKPGDYCKCSIIGQGSTSSGIAGCNVCQKMRWS